MRALSLLLAPLILGLVALSVPACSNSDEAPSTPPASTPLGYEGLGPHPVGHAIFTLEDPARSRTLTVQIWYPATDAGRDQATAGTALDDLVPDPTDRASLDGLLAKAPEGCTSRRTRSAAGLDPIAGPLPLVVFSHCNSCVRFSAFSVAEALASRGIAVIAPDHADDTLFTRLAGDAAPINDAFLAIRVGDIKATLDAALDPAGAALPAALRGHFNADHLAMMGHSYGGLTTGATLVAEPRIKAGFIMAAPPAFIGGVTMAAIKQPVFMLLAREDNSIGEIGNNTIRGNYKDANPPAWLAEVSDAGHWSFSDIAGLAPWLVPGCGEGVRQTDKDVNFSYLANDTGRSLASAYASAFFSLTLLGDESARPYLAAAHLAEVGVSTKLVCRQFVVGAAGACSRNHAAASPRILASGSSLAARSSASEISRRQSAASGRLVNRTRMLHTPSPAPTTLAVDPISSTSRAAVSQDPTRSAGFCEARRAAARVRLSSLG